MIVPIFSCDDSLKATKFYVEALGFNFVARYQPDENLNDPAYVTIALNDNHLHLTSFPASQGSGKMAYVYYDDPQEVDALYERIKNRTDLIINMPACRKSVLGHSRAWHY